MGNPKIGILRKMYPPHLLMIGWIYFLLSSPLHAAFEFKPPSARPLGLGGAFTGLANDLNAIDYNPAGLRLIPGFQFSSTYTNLYGVEGLNYTQLKLGCPIQGYGTAGILFSDFGPAEYKERMIVFSHGFGLAEGIIFGYNLKSMSVKIQDYGSDSAFGLDVSVLARISEDLGLGACAKNINEPEISKGHEKLGQEFWAGLYYKPLQGLNFAFDMEKVMDKQAALHIGTEFRLTDFFALRTGLSTNPSNYSFGAGINYGVFCFDYGYLSHATLDALHVVSLSMKFGGEQEASLKFTPKPVKGQKVKKLRRRADASSEESQEPAEPSMSDKKVNINAASEDELVELPSISKSLARSIREYREANGPFKSIEDIMNVPRMSKRTFSKIESMITAGTAASRPEAEQGEPAAPAVDDAKKESQQMEKDLPAAAEKRTPKIIESDKININRASLPQFLDLGFTTVQAESILKYIKDNGPFTSVDDLKKVPGISEDVISEVRDNISAK